MIYIFLIGFVICSFISFLLGREYQKFVHLSSKEVKLYKGYSNIMRNLIEDESFRNKNINVP